LTGIGLRGTQHNNIHVVGFFKISTYVVGSGGAHSGIAGDYFLVECDTFFLVSYLLMFVRDVMKTSSYIQGSSSPMRFAYLTQIIRE
jgi:hypothetical protein